MDVTRHNFKEALLEVKTLLPQASFIGFDTEFTGLGSDTPNNLKGTPFDTLEERYYWRQFNTKNYNLIQLGLSIFIYDPANHCYAVHPYNFHVFNSQSNKNFSAEPRTLQFLVSAI